MFHKEKVGELEVVYPDEDLKDVLKDVVKQNEKILDMNKIIITTMVSAPILVKEGGDAE